MYQRLCGWRLSDSARRVSMLRDSLQSLVDVPEDVLRVLDADRKPDHVGAHARARKLFVIELAVRGGGWVDHERLCVADIREMAQEFAHVDEALAGFRGIVCLDAEGEDARGAGQAVDLAELL